MRSSEQLPFTDTDCSLDLATPVNRRVLWELQPLIKTNWSKTGLMLIMKKKTGALVLLLRKSDYFHFNELLSLII